MENLFLIFRQKEKSLTASSFSYLIFKTFKRKKKEWGEININIKNTLGYVSDAFFSCYYCIYDQKRLNIQDFYISVFFSNNILWETISIQFFFFKMISVTKYACRKKYVSAFSNKI